MVRKMVKKMVKKSPTAKRATKFRFEDWEKKKSHFPCRLLFQPIVEKQTDQTREKERIAHCSNFPLSRDFGRLYYFPG